MREEVPLMWVEKYRPERLEDVIDHEEIIARIKELLKKPSTMPHMLFAGPPGNGKTTVALCIARKLFGERWREYTLETNASDERGIPMVREKIKAFSRMGTMGEAPFRLLILDESDELTHEAQTALRRIMEMSSRTCRFILICNHSSKIIEPIQSRCAIFRFSELKKKDVADYLRFIASKEGVKVTDGALDALWEFFRGDLRRSINTLQASAALGKTIMEKEIIKVIGRARPSDIREMISLALEGEFTKARDKLYELLFIEGIAGIDIVREMSREVFRLDLSEEEKSKIIDMIGECEFRLVEGATEEIQLGALLAKISALRA